MTDKAKKLVSDLEHWSAEAEWQSANGWKDADINEAMRNTKLREKH